MSVAHRAKTILPEGIWENTDTVSDSIQLLLRFVFSLKVFPVNSCMTQH